MKQRLLLALLMLLTSAGFMKAQTIQVVSYGTSDVVLTFDKGVSITGGTAELNDTKTTVTIKKGETGPVSINTEQASSIESVSGNVKELSHTSTLSSLTSITCSGTSLQTLGLKNANGLKTLNASNNKISTLSLPTATTLTSIDLSNNALTGTLNVASYAGLTSLNVSDNQLDGVTVATAQTALKTLNVSGNKIKTISNLPTGLTPTYGTQTLTASPTGKPANTPRVVSDVAATLLSGVGTSVTVTADQISSITWTKLDGTVYKADNTTPHSLGTPSDAYYFYDNTGLFVDGTYRCEVIFNDKHATYKGRTFRFDGLVVSPAEVELQATSVTGVESSNVSVNGSFNLATPDLKVKQGETVTLSVTTAEIGYDARKTEWKDLKGLVALGGASAPYVGKTYQFKVAAKYNASTKETEEPRLAVAVPGYSHKVVFDNATQEGGSFSVKKVVGTEEKTLNSGDAVLYGETLVISVKANEGYKPTLLVNKQEVLLDKLDDQVSTSVTNYTGTVEIKDDYDDNTNDIAISVNFGANDLKLTATVDGVTPDKFRSDASYLAENKIEVRQVNGATSKILGPDGETSIAGIKADTQYEIYFELADHHRLKGDVTINGGKLVKKTANYDSTNKKMCYTVVFNVEKSDVQISIMTRVQTELTVNLVKTDKDGTKQEQTYDGSKKPVLFTTTPANLGSKLKVKYTNKTSSPEVGMGEGVEPTEVGKYGVEFLILDEDGDYYLEVQPSPAEYSIVKADLVIETLPTVTVTSDAKYAITGGKVTFNGKEVEEGKWSVDPSAPAGSNLTETHTVNVTYTPHSSVVANFNEAKAQVIVKVGNTELTTYQVKVISVPSGYSLKWYNGQKEVNISSEKFPAETELTAVLTYPAGTKDVVLEKTNTAQQSLLSSPTESAGKKVYTLTVKADTELKIVAGTGNKYTVKFNEEIVKYSGEPQNYASTNVTISDAEGQKVDFVNVGAVISYKDIDQPKDAGTYTVIVTIPANEATGYVETVASEAVFTIEKIDPVILTMPKSTLLAKGQKLEMSELVSGASNIPGKFEWVDPTKTFSTAGQSQEDIKFTPADEYLKNYNVLYPKAADGTSLQVSVQVSAIQILTFVQPVEGSILVANQDGKYLETGSAISKGDVLTVTVVPKDNFKLKSILVNGASSGNVITVGESSIAIEATFEVDVPEPEEPEIDPNSQYAVTVTKSLRGAVISKPGVNAVKKDQSFSFTVTTLPADASKIKVTAGGSVITPSSTGVYTIAKVTSNMTVDVSFTSAPTELTIDIPREYKNKGGYLIGRVQVEGPSDGKCYYNDEITLVAFPESGVKFTRWTGDKTSTEQVLTVVLTGNLKMEANFSGTPTGIEDIMAASIATGKGCVWVRGIANADVTIVSIAGRVQARQRISGDTRIDVPAGIYVVVLESGSDVKRVKVIVK